MGKKQISRKEFFTRTLTGLAGISLISKDLKVPATYSQELRSIGKTGIMVSPVCFGAPRTNEESLIKYAVSKGINFIDTGRSYGNGNNERLVGRAISGQRDKTVIQSKIRLDENELPSKGKGKKGAAEIRNALQTKIDASLKALNSSYIDVLLYHDAADENLLFHTETMKFFADMKSSGVIKAHGFSTHNDFMNLPERNNKEVFYDVIMVPFNPKGSFVHSVTGNYSEWDQKKLISVLSEAGEKGIGVIAMKTCSGGKHSLKEGSEPTFKDSVLWVLQHKFISSAAIAMANFEQVDEHTSWL
ncbi:MAG: aldo/keto reductase [Bacteroidales bacterium]|nr:aldo/keto reductase [Bacteroidales bacterium]